MTLLLAVYFLQIPFTSHRFSENTFLRAVKGLKAVKKIRVTEMRKLRFIHLYL
jgi:hypothetical protein